jgi:hypothetical protein
MGAWSYEELKEHVGHRVVCVCYSNEPDILTARGRLRKGRKPASVSIECETCNCVLLSYDRPWDGEG